MKAIVVVVIVAIFLNVETIDAKNVLAMASCLSGSHHLWVEKLVYGLAVKGHNVTMISHDRKKVEHKNYHLLYIPGSYEKVQHGYDIEEMPKHGEAIGADMFYDYMSTTNKFIAESDAFKTLMNYPKDFKFDVILWDMTSGESLYPVIKRFGNPPVVGLSPFGVQPYINEIMGNPMLSYIPFYMKHFKQPMSLLERIENTMDMYSLLRARGKYMAAMDVEARKIFGDKIDDLYEVEKNISLVLANYDPNFDIAQPLSPNIIPVGGLQAVTPKPLPMDLADLYDKDKNGIIYFSLGTNLRSEKVDKNILNSFIGCFANLDHTVLWKIKDFNMELPKNVIARPWMPQNDILAHPKTKIFISHGGLLSSQESISHGVPLVIFPFVADQLSNAAKYEELGYARQVNFRRITEKYVCDAIKDVLYNDKYKNNVQQASKRIKGHQNTAIDRAVHWVEFAMNNGRLEYLSPPSRRMSIVTVLNLDLIGLAFLVGLLPFFAVFFFCCRQGGKGSEEKVKRN